MLIVVHPDDWVFAPVVRQERYDAALETQESYSMTVAHPELASRGELVGHTVAPDGTVGPRAPLAAYRGPDVPPCGLPRWEHHRSELLALDYPCAADHMEVTCNR
jgi:hypothetical protein